MEFLLAASEFRDPLLPLWAMEWLARGLLYAWLFCFGATVGSFLNVVVYRLPRGKNLAYPGSFCPRCGHPIRLNDNVPILSWLALRGRCRDCGGRISPRYFFVELATAAMFLIVLACEHYLPAGALGFATRRLLTPYDGVSFWCMYATHIGLVTTIFGSVLIAADGFIVDRRLFLPIIVAGFVMPLAWPEIRSVPAASYSNDGVWWAGLTDGLAGLAAALVFRTLVTSTLIARPTRELPRLTPLGWATAIGIILGWQRSIYALPLMAVVTVCSVRALRRFNRVEPETHDSPPGPPHIGEAAENAGLTSMPEQRPSPNERLSVDQTSSPPDAD